MISEKRRSMGVFSPFFIKEQASWTCPRSPPFPSFMRRVNLLILSLDVWSVTMLLVFWETPDKEWHMLNRWSEQNCYLMLMQQIPKSRVDSRTSSTSAHLLRGYHGISVISWASKWNETFIFYYPCPEAYPRWHLARGGAHQFIIGLTHRGKQQCAHTFTLIGSFESHPIHAQLQRSSPSLGSNPNLLWGNSASQQLNMLTSKLCYFQQQRGVHQLRMIKQNIQRLSLCLVSAWGFTLS